jgi:hypothetical protein
MNQLARGHESVNTYIYIHVHVLYADGAINGVSRVRVRFSRSAKWHLKHVYM